MPGAVSVECVFDCQAVGQDLACQTLCEGDLSSVRVRDERAVCFV